MVVKVVVEGGKRLVNRALPYARNLTREQVAEYLQSLVSKFTDDREADEPHTPRAPSRVFWAWYKRLNKLDRREREPWLAKLADEMARVQGERVRVRMPAQWVADP
jgi:CRISPR/Cas system type I-B associated protein Csh2 (Cas7 group RAMP superfamily)